MKRFFTFFGLLFFFLSQAQAQPRIEEAPKNNYDFHYDYDNEEGESVESSSERILLFHSDIKVEENTDVLVTETIKVYAKGQEIKRGLFRALPMVRNTKNGRENINYKILSVKKDGVTEDYHTETVNKVFNIYIGNKNVILSPNYYTYEIVYKTQDQIAHFDGFDELYWNVNGTDWAFPIERIEAKVSLPAGATILQNSCYTGVFGSTEQNCSSAKLTDTSMKFSAEKLEKSENLTIAVGFKAGVLKEPSAIMKWLKKNWPSLFLLLPCFYLAYFYYDNWKKYGKDPEKPVVIPQFNAPKKLSPASLGYIQKGDFNISFATANLIDLAVKGYLTIDEVKEPSKKNYLSKNYVLKRLKKKAIDLQHDEEILLKKIFGKSLEVEIDGAYASKIKNAVYDLENVVIKNSKKFVENEKNTPLVLRALKIIVVVFFSGLILAAIFTKNPAGVIFGIFTLLFDGAIVFFLFYLWKQKSKKAFFISLIFTVPFLIPVFFLAFPSSANIGSFEADCFKFLILGMISLLIFQDLINKPSQEKVNMEAEIEGFKMYLGTAELNQLQFFNPPEMTPEVYEKFLPYAIVFGVEGIWGKKLREKLRSTLYAEDQNLTEHQFTHHFAQSLSTVLASTATSPVYHSTSSSSSSSSSSRSSSSSSYSGGSSSSGSSGGGSSGGGGGGGGGGGW